MSNARNADAEGFEQLCDVVCGCFAFNIRVGCKDNFLNFFTLDALAKFVYSKHLRSYSVHWGKNAAENMVPSVIFTHTLHKNNIARIFNNAQGVRAAFRIGADLANLIFRIVTADRAKMNKPVRILNRIRKGCCILIGKGDNMVSKPLCCFDADSGQAVEPRDKSVETFHFVLPKNQKPKPPRFPRPPVTFDISFSIVSLARRTASFTAERIRS